MNYSICMVGCSGNSGDKNGNEKLLGEDTVGEGSAALKNRAGSFQSEKLQGDVKQEISAQDDFYASINQETLKNIELHYGESYGGPAAEIMDIVENEVFQVIKEAAEGPAGAKPSTSYSEEKRAVRELYQAYLERLSEKEQIKKEFEAWVNLVQRGKSLKELLSVLGQLMEKNGLGMYFDFSVDRDFYHAERHAVYLEQKTDFCGTELKSVYEGEESREKLHSFAMDVLVACGEEPEDADEKAKDMVYLILEIACSTDYEIMESVNPFLTFQFYSEKEMDDFCKTISSKGLENIFGIKKNPYQGIYIQDRKQLQKLMELFTEENLETLKTYVLCEMFSKYQAVLARIYDFMSLYTPEAYQSEEKKAAAFVNELLPEQVGDLYVEKYETKEMDEIMDRMYMDIKKGYEKLIRGADWLSVDSRRSLLRKLKNLRFIRKNVKNNMKKGKSTGGEASTLFRRVTEIFKEKHKEDLARIGTKNERGNTGMTPQTVNAVYTTDNTFTVTPAMLHAPYFDVAADYATNLGGIGMVMAHEIGHAFDSNLMDYDENGDYHPDWISENDRKILKKRTENMIRYYSEFTILDVYHVNGKLTCGENYADKSGMECLMKIVTTKEERKKIFENYAKIWCTLMEDQVAIMQLQKNEHSPEYIRVNGVLSSTEEFYELYHISQGDGMYVEPGKRVSVWEGKKS